MIRRRIRSLQKKLGSLHIDLGDYRQTVFLAGSGRSGTTWVQDIINFDGSYRIMFEPFHCKKLTLLKEWGYHQYLRSGNRDEKFLHPATSILAGKIRNEWIDQFNQKWIARKRLIKDIRANLLLKWIRENFPEVPIILLLRHPCAVASSRLKLGWETQLSDFLVQDDLMIDFLNPFKDIIEGVKDNFDRHILMWAVDNYVPLRQFRKGEILVVFYEDVCRNPQNEIQKILSFIGEQFSPRVFKNVAKPSAKAGKDSAIFSGDDVISSWRKHVTGEQIAGAMEIIRVFGFDAIYGDGDLPLVSGEEALGVFGGSIAGAGAVHRWDSAAAGR